jgi:ABC transport system ATP-binding/permease protein
MASRWAFEALAVEQFAKNRFQRSHFFEYEQQNSDASFKASFLIPRLISKVELIERNLNLNIDVEQTAVNLRILQNEIEYLQQVSGLMPFEYINNINAGEFSGLVAEETMGYLIYLRLHFSQVARDAALERDNIYRDLENSLGSLALHNIRENHYNKALADILLNRHEVNVLYKTDTRLVQKKDPVYLLPESNIGRAHFYAASKQFNHVYVDTLWFNVSVLWLMSLILYLAILVNAPRKFIAFFESLKFLKK